MFQFLFSANANVNLLQHISPYVGLVALCHWLVGLQLNSTAPISMITWAPEGQRRGGRPADHLEEKC